MMPHQSVAKGRPMGDLLRPEDLRKITDDLETVKMKEILERDTKARQQLKDVHDAFMQRDIHPDVKKRINEAIKHAAEQGLSEIQVLTFPSDYCNDRGRKINNLDPDWPNSLEGFAKKAFVYYEKELRSLGYKLRAQVLNYPDGMPGDVGLFLKW